MRARPSRSFAALVLAAPLLLAVGRLAPAEGAGVALRLAAAGSCVLLLPGALVLRALAWPSSVGLACAGAFAWSLAAVFLAFALTFAVQGSLWLTIGLLGLVSVAALARAARVPPARLERSDRLAALAVVAGGVAFAGLVWWAVDTISGSPGATAGDALFHLARVRKLDEMPVLSSLGAVDEFRDGGLHPGYAFPLWHGALALVARLAGVDPAVLFLHLPAILTPLALFLAYAAGGALFGTWAGGVAAASAQAAVLGFERAGVGSFQFLSQPGAAARLLLAPALLALIFAFVAGGRRALLLSIAAAALGLAVVHPTYALFVALPLAGFLVARLALAPNDRAGAGRIAAALAAALLPAGFFFLWLSPVVAQAASHDPSREEQARSLARYAGLLEVSGSSFRPTPGFLAWGGGATVAALVAVPLAALAARRAWSAYVLGGTLAVLIAALAPTLFTPLSHAVSVAQSLRLGAFLPLPFALAGAATLAGRGRLAGAAAALGTGLAFQLLYPGTATGAGWAVWVAAGGGLVALGGAAALGLGRCGLAWREGARAPGGWTAVAAVAFVLPVAVAGFAHARREGSADPYALTPGLVRALRADVRPGAVVLSNVETSYRIAAYAPVHIVAAPPGHVARTRANRPYERQWDVVRFFFRPGTSAAERARLLRRYGAGWLVVDKAQGAPPAPGRLRLAYEDARYVLYRLPGT